MASAARGVLSFKSAQASCRRNIHCAEIHSRDRGTIAAPGPPLSRGKRRESAEESESRGGREGAEDALSVLQAHGGEQAPPSTGRHRRGHRPAMASGAKEVPAFHEHPSIVPAEYPLR